MTHVGRVALAIVGALLTLLLVPRRMLLGAALILFVLPLDYGATQDFALHYVLGMIPILVYVVRVRGSARIDPVALGMLTGILALGGLAAIASPYTARSAVFLLTAVCLGLTMCLRATPGLDQAHLTQVWATCAVLLSAYALIEYTLEYNLLDQWFAESTFPLVQKWSGYRVQTTIGHPLVNGTFFAASFGLFVWQAVGGTHLRPKVAVFGILLTLFATVATGSRSAIVAAALCGLVVASFSAVHRQKLICWMLCASIVVGVGLALNFWSTDRLSSMEAVRSSHFRSEIYGNALKLLSGHQLLGAGPGAAEPYNAVFGVRPELPLESSILEALIGWGIIGFCALMVFSVRYIAQILQNDRVAASAPLVAIAVSGAFYNMLEGQTKVLVLTALAAILSSASIPGGSVPKPEEPNIALAKSL